MSEQRPPVESIDVDEPESLTIHQVCTILELKTEVVCEWVAEGVVRPSGERIGEWRFPAWQLDRALRARRLQRDLDLNTESLPLVLDLLGEIEQLRARLRVVEVRYFE